jgi:hypothetical protein
MDERTVTTMRTGDVDVDHANACNCRSQDDCQWTAHLCPRLTRPARPGTQTVPRPDPSLNAMKDNGDRFPAAIDEVSQEALRS